MQYFTVLPVASVYISLARISGWLYMDCLFSPATIPLSKDRALSWTCGWLSHFCVKGDNRVCVILKNMIFHNHWNSSTIKILDKIDAFANFIPLFLQHVSFNFSNVHRLIKNLLTTLCEMDKVWSSKVNAVM